tara:strand:- start:349 stop:741 length:393 start_codon:yes stop_codon:yes gene_type:complete
VSEIAQRLADKMELSSTLSELLRQAYGFGDKVEEKKRELTALLDEKDRMRTKEQELVEEIDRMEAELLDKKAIKLPQLTDRLRILEARRQRIQREVNMGVTENFTNNKLRVLANIDELIKATEEEMEEYQ